MGTVARQTPLGRLVEETRESQGLTVKELAKKAGVSASTVDALEHGRFPKPQDRTLKKVGKALGLNLDDSEPHSPYVDIINEMDDEIQRQLVTVGSWLAAMTDARRRQKLAELTVFIHTDKPDDGPITKTVHSGPPAPE